MKTNTRFIKSICETANHQDIAMPWARGARRADFITKRTAAPIAAKNAA